MPLRIGVIVWSPDSLPNTRLHLQGRASTIGPPTNEVGHTSAPLSGASRCCTARRLDLAPSPRDLNALSPEEGSQVLHLCEGRFVDGATHDLAVAPIERKGHTSWVVGPDSAALELNLNALA